MLKPPKLQPPLHSANRIPLFLKMMLINFSFRTPAHCPFLMITHLFLMMTSQNIPSTLHLHHLYTPSISLNHWSYHWPLLLFLYTLTTIHFVSEWHNTLNCSWALTRHKTSNSIKKVKLEFEKEFLNDEKIEHLTCISKVVALPKNDLTLWMQALTQAKVEAVFKVKWPKE